MATTQPRRQVHLRGLPHRTAPPDRRYELLDGDLIMVSAPNLKHQTVQLQLATRLANLPDGYSPRVVAFMGGLRSMGS